MQNFFINPFTDPVRIHLITIDPDPDADDLNTGCIDNYAYSCSFSVF